jgi:hypothetical protein
MDRFSARRKLLRGSLSAPLVLTVASPSALARSSFLACITRGDNPEGEGPYAPSPKADNLYREKGSFWTICPPPAAAQIQGLPEATCDTLYIRRGTTIFRRVDYQGGAFVLPPKTPDGGDWVVTEVTRWELVYFDPDSGVRTGSGYFPNNGSAVSHSCWASFITLVP